MTCTGNSFLNSTFVSLLVHQTLSAILFPYIKLQPRSLETQLLLLHRVSSMSLKTDAIFSGVFCKELKRTVLTIWAVYFQPFANFLIMSFAAYIRYN